MSSPDNPSLPPPGAPAPQGLGAPEILPPLEVPPPRAPVENPVWNGWDVLLIFGISLVTIFLLQLAIVLGARRFYPHSDLAELAQQPIVLLVAQFLIDGAVALFLFLLIESKYHVRFWQAIRWNWPRSEWIPLAGGPLLFLGLAVLENFLPMPKDTPFDKLFARPRDAYLVSIIAVSVGPLVEELFFRGFLYPVIARRWGFAWGIFWTALPFALLHLQQYGYAWGAGLVIFIVGVACGAVRAATKSVAASFLVHVGYNGTQMLIAVIATQGFRHMPKGFILPWLS